MTIKSFGPEHRPLKMRNVVFEAKNLGDAVNQQELRNAATDLIKAAIGNGHTFLRTESQNNKIRAFFAEERFEVSLRFV
jgi:hypothetical protein